MPLELFLVMLQASSSRPWLEEFLPSNNIKFSLYWIDTKNTNTLLSPILKQQLQKLLTPHPSKRLLPHFSVSFYNKTPQKSCLCDRLHLALLILI